MGVDAGSFFIYSKLVRKFNFRTRTGTSMNTQIDLFNSVAIAQLAFAITLLAFALFWKFSRK